MVEEAVEDVSVIAGIKRLRDVGFNWKTIGETLNLSPSSLYRLRKEARVHDPLLEPSIG